MGTTCQLGEVRSLGIPADAPWEDVLDAILLASNRLRNPGWYVGRDTYEAARGIVPPQLPIEYLRSVNPSYGVCTRLGSGSAAVGGLAMVPVSFAHTFGGGADPTDPWTALVMVVAAMRRIAEQRLGPYAAMWETPLGHSGSGEGAAYSDVALGFAKWYEDHPAWEMTNAAREAGFRAVLQYPGWGTLAEVPSLLPGVIERPPLHFGGIPDAAVWPKALTDDLDFWGLVLLEMLAENVVPGLGGYLLDKLWKGILNEGNGGLRGYYSSGGQPSPAFATLLHDGIVWVRPVRDYARYLIEHRTVLPAGQRNAMNLSGNDVSVLSGSLIKVAEVLHRMPEQTEAVTVGPFAVGGDEIGWQQLGVVAGYTGNVGVPVPDLYSTLSAWDDSTETWAGFLMAPPQPPPPTPPTPPGVPGEPVTETRRTSPILPLAFGLAVPLVGYWVWMKWRTM